MTKQPGMNLNCARSPLRLENENTVGCVPVSVAFNHVVARDLKC